MEQPKIIILNHSKNEFPTVDALTMWLLTALKARHGKYLRTDKLKVLPSPGSVVLFRYGDKIIGEAVTLHYKHNDEDGYTIAGRRVKYKARFEFAPTSIRIFAPPFPIQKWREQISKSPNILVARGAKIIDDWNIYPRLLACHFEIGGILI